MILKIKQVKTVNLTDSQQRLQDCVDLLMAKAAGLSKAGGLQDKKLKLRNKRNEKKGSSSKDEMQRSKNGYSVMLNASEPK